MQTYGVGALCLNTQNITAGGRNTISRNPTTAEAGVDVTDEDRPRQMCARIKNAVTRILSCIRSGKQAASRSNSATSQKRAILQMALGYSMACFIHFGCSSPHFRCDYS